MTWSPVAHARTFGPAFALLLAMSGFREMQPQCKSTDWLCKAMVQYCQAIPDPCTPSNVDQPWHPENPNRWLNALPDLDPGHIAPEQPNGAPPQAYP